jgi:hypothetical protein
MLVVWISVPKLIVFRRGVIRDVPSVVKARMAALTHSTLAVR